MMERQVTIQLARRLDRDGRAFFTARCVETGCEGMPSRAAKDAIMGAARDYDRATVVAILGQLPPLVDGRARVALRVRYAK